MTTENAPYQILVAGGNQALLAAGSRVDALNSGQIGIFNFHTGLSIDGTSIPDAKDIIIAVGIGGTNPATDIRRSAGQMIQVDKVKDLTMKGANDEVPKIIEITGYNTYCDTDYLLNIEFRSRRILQQEGTNQLMKPYSVHTPACGLPYCQECGDLGQPVDLAQPLVDLINADADKILTAALFINQSAVTISAGASANGTLTITIGAEIFSVPVTSGDSAAVVAGKIVTFIKGVTTSAYSAELATATVKVYAKTSGVAVPAIVLTSAGGTSVAFSGASANTTPAISDSASFKTINPGVAPIIRLTATVETRLTSNGAINLRYFKSGYDFLVSGKLGFMSNSTITTTQNLKYTEGQGYDLKQLEYVAGGWNGQPGVYRQYSDGLGKDSFTYLVDGTAKYVQVVLDYENTAIGGGRRYQDSMGTILVFPCADTTTRDALITVFDLIFTQFGGNANDASNLICTAAATSTLTYATDGIESLA